MTARAKQSAARQPAVRAEPADRVLTITRTFDAPRSLVFKAWTEGEHLAQWCAPRGFTIPQSEGDVRPGGHWRATMCSPDGQEYRVSGVYREVVKDELLVFTHAWENEQGERGHETLVTVRFADKGQKTELIFCQTMFESVASRDSHQGGWTETLDRLAEHLAMLRARPAI